MAGVDGESAPRIIAVDWSGAKSGANKKIWLAEASDGRLPYAPESGRDPNQLAEHLVAIARQDPRLVVGLDFAFSLPRWFLTERGLTNAPDLWALAEREGETWLTECRPPFWGRPGKKKPSMPDEYRRTDTIAAPGGTRPKSVFQIGGAGAVGTGSIRGMPILSRLREAEFSIWPFDPPGWPLVIEIWPRALLKRPVVKSDRHERASYLQAEYPELNAEQLTVAAATDDAFDATTSALVMEAHADELASLPPVSDPAIKLEGQIWFPGWDT